ncbi:hypothetical protein UlMin_039622 [Ulmus minor]
MDYASDDLHSQNQLQEQIVGQPPPPSSSSLPIAPRTVPSTNIWNQSIFLNSLNPQDLSYSDVIRSFTPLSNKEETSNSFSNLRITTLIPSPPQVEKSQNENMWFGNSLLSDYEVSEQDLPSANYYSNAQFQNHFGGGFRGVASSNRYDFGHIFPTISTNKTTSDSLMSSSSRGYNLQALDLLSSSAYRSQSSSPSSHSNGLYRDISTSSCHDEKQGSKDSPSNSSNISSPPAFFNEVQRTKRSSSSNPEVKKESHADAKKSKPSNPPLKVKKEKLGERVAALHRLVAPFGKTDTASVLTEAIGYIQFLHDQVQTLSMPYMKSLQRKSYRKMQQGLSKEEETATKIDLKSRGLCLVPQSCASYLNGFD